MNACWSLSAEEDARYEWQRDVRGFGVEGQRRLKQTSVLISRVGGVGGSVALPLAAAGIGRLILAHAGNVRLNDLNRQLLMTTGSVGHPRIESAHRRLQELNPHVVIETVDENINEHNAATLIAQCDIVVSAAPLFAERLLMNREAVRQSKPFVDAAMFELEGRVMTVFPGTTACLECLYPEPPPNWQRRFPVFGAVSSVVGSLAAMEVIKIAANLGVPLAGQLLQFDLRNQSFRKWPLSRRDDCLCCGSAPKPPCVDEC